MADEASPDTNSAPQRKRASKACLACRARKVRCDVARREAPCTNCILDKKQCIVKPRPTKYRASKRRAAIAAAMQMGDLLPCEENNESPPLHPDSGTESTSTIHIDPLIEEVFWESPKARAVPGNASLGDLDSSTFEFVDSPELVVSESRSSVDVMFSYYPFLVLDVLPHVSSNDVNFMEQNGCFRVPTRPVLEEFLKEYFLHVHPGLPMIDEGRFYEMYRQREVSPQSPRMSLFVFQAMLFASCSFVSLDVIRKLGFSSSRSARQGLYRRAKFLFDFIGEKDSMVTSQGALLLAYNASMRHLKRVNTFWLGNAIQFAKDADAHKYHTTKNLSPERRNALKRLWWCCIIRDRILPLGVRRPLQISSSDFDFQIAPLTKEDFETEIYRSEVYDVATKHLLTDLLLTLCDLAVELTGVIETVYPLSEPAENPSEEEVAQNLSRVDSCKTTLNMWFERATLMFPTPAGLGDRHESCTLYTNLMYMYYHSAILALYNHEIFVVATQASRVESYWNLVCEGRRKLEEGTGALTENIQELIQLKLAKYMPVSVIAYAALPLVLHILDVKLSSTPSQAARKQGRLNIYNEAYKALKSQYDGTDEVSGFIGRMIEYISMESSAMTATPFAQASKALDLGRTSPSKQPGASTPIHEWSDVLLQHPKLYTRLIVTVDMCLANGYFPEEISFPSALQSNSILGPRFPLFRMLSNTPSTTSNNSTQKRELKLDEKLDLPPSIHNFDPSEFVSIDEFASQLQASSTLQSASPSASFLGLYESLPGETTPTLIDGFSPAPDSSSWADGMFLAT